MIKIRAKRINGKTGVATNIKGEKDNVLREAIAVYITLNNLLKANAPDVYDAFIEAVHSFEDQEAIEDAIRKEEGEHGIN